MNYNYDDRQWDDDFENEPTVEDPETILQDCLFKFHSPDYIMESGIFTQLMKYFRVGGRPEIVIDLLSNNYVGVADTTNLLADWLVLSGFSSDEVQVMTENHLQEMIVKNFDPKKADTIFALEGQTPQWLSEMIHHKTWRFLIYRLAEEYPECLMLNFIIRLIAYAGFQGEITSISVVAQQMDIFSIVMKTAISNCLHSSYDEQSKYIEECAKLACHGQHTYIYSSLLLYTMSQEGKSACNIKRLYQELTKVARSKHDVTAITMALHGAAKFPHISGPLSSMLSRNSLNPADITVLYRNYASMDPPPIEFIRNPQFLELLIDSLFKPGTKLNPEHKSKYIYLLAYASSVYEIFGSKKVGSKKFTNQDEIQQTTEAIDKVHSICLSVHGSTELISELQTLFQCIKFPVVSIGIIRWVECRVTEPSYFKLCTEHTPTHLVLLDEIVSTHFLLQDMILHIIIKLFQMKHTDLDVLVQLEIKRMLIDRLVNLSCHGCVVPVIKFIDHLWKSTDTDVSLIRYFVTEVLEKICPPYSLEFANLFLPIVENDEVTGTMRCGDGENDPVSEFIVHCKGMGL